MLLLVACLAYVGHTYRDESRQASADQVQAVVVNKIKSGRRGRRKHKLIVHVDGERNSVRVSGSEFGSYLVGETIDLEVYSDGTLHLPGEDHSRQRRIALLGALVFAGLAGHQVWKHYKGNSA